MIFYSPTRTGACTTSTALISLLSCSLELQAHSGAGGRPGDRPTHGAAVACRRRRARAAAAPQHPRGAGLRQRHAIMHARRCPGAAAADPDLQVRTNPAAWMLLWHGVVLGFVCCRACKTGMRGRCCSAHAPGLLTACRHGWPRVALASGHAAPVERPDGSGDGTTGVWLLDLAPASGAAATEASLLAMPAQAACVLAPGDGCLCAGGGNQDSVIHCVAATMCMHVYTCLGFQQLVWHNGKPCMSRAGIARIGEDGSVKCWQPAAAGAAQWDELPVLRQGGGGLAGVQHLWVVSQQPLQLGARVGTERLVIWDLERCAICFARAAHSRSSMSDGVAMCSGAALRMHQRFHLRRIFDTSVTLRIPCIAFPYPRNNPFLWPPAQLGILK